MKRAIPTLVATLGGLALLANFHTAVGVKPRPVTTPVTPTTPAAGSGPPPSGSTSTAGAAPQTGTRQVDGLVIATRFGDVQVRVTLANGKITNVVPLQMPFDHQRSEEISQQVAPILHDEVLQTQTAQIDLVSGATYTSDAYQQSLQSALDQSR